MNTQTKWLAWAVALILAGSAFGDPVVLETKQYKRIHLQAMEAIVDGNAQGCIEALREHDASHPGDPETQYVLACAYAQSGELDEAMACAEEAAARGLPVERFLAGPRGLLAPLARDERFVRFAAARCTEPIHGPMLGRVTHETASFWVRTASEASVRVRASESANLEGARESNAALANTGTDYTAIVQVTGLEPNTAYYYDVAINGKTADVSHALAFRTFPKPGRPAAFRVGFGGGAGYVPDHERAWDTVRGLKPVAFLLLGDNVYIDHPTYPDLQDYCYYRRQSRPEYRRFVASSAIYAIYDDHDFGTNDCWGGPEIESPSWKRDVWKRFKANWANPSYGGGEPQPGCWFDCTIADVHFIFLDCRYYRTSPKQRAPSMLGPVQKAWLFERLKGSSGAFKVLASSVPWASGTKPGSRDTWDGYDAEREAIFSFIEDHQIPGVVLLSADRHRSDVWRIERENGYALYEFESSRLTNQHVHKKMAGALFSYNESQSFGILDFDTTKADPEVRYGIVNIDGETVHEMTLRRSQLAK